MNENRRGMALSDTDLMVTPPGKFGLISRDRLLEMEAESGNMISVVWRGHDVRVRFVEGHDVEDWIRLEFGTGVITQQKGDLSFILRSNWKLDE